MSLLFLVGGPTGSTIKYLAIKLIWMYSLIISSFQTGQKK